jgi:hypothetical protein
MLYRYEIVHNTSANEGYHIANERSTPARRRKVVCWNCDEQAHISRIRPEPKHGSRVQCMNCDEMGHSIAVSPSFVQREH